ncbi:MAG TPA: hypothetical protein VFR31_16615 [Thermoanaerobaculia bacterium]|nr:hypothetical protein [Thermoanaerobaculia bacterium]
MDIQEFSRQLERDDQASRLIQALRQLRVLDLAAFRGLDLSRLGWPTWPELAGLSEPRR